MKKIIVLFAFSLLIFTGTTYAGSDGNQVPESVNAVFNQHFSLAKDIKWEVGKNFYKATFEVKGKTLFAFFSDNGEVIGVAANLSSVKLPEELRSEIKKSYADYWITDLFQYRTADEDGFVVTLEGPDKVVILKTNDAREWRIFRTTVKN